MNRSAQPSDCSLSVFGSLGGSPGGLIFFTFFLIILAFVGLHGVGDGSEIITGLGIFSVYLSFFSSGGLLGIWVSVHEEINHDVPLLVAGDFTTELKGLASEEPEAVGNGVTSLVVSGDGNVNPVERGVRVSESNNGDVHVGSLGQALVVETWVANDNKSGFEELLGVLVGKSSGYPLATEVVSTGVSGELEDGALSVLARGHDLKRKLIIKIIKQTRSPFFKAVTPRTEQSLLGLRLNSDYLPGHPFGS